MVSETAGRPVAPSRSYPASLDALNFLLADVRGALGPYLNVFLVTQQHWSQGAVAVLGRGAGHLALLRCVHQRSIPGRDTLIVPQAQWDAARSLGMTRGLMLRIVVLPQALRLAAPPYVSLCVSLVKATSLVSIVGLWELTLASREVVERTLAPFQIFIGAAAIYFSICCALAIYGRHLERRVLLGH
jgi:hypothetical protein